jgi:hypothetical protein
LEEELTKVSLWTLGIVAVGNYCVWRRYLGDMGWFADEKSHDDVQSRRFILDRWDVVDNEEDVKN